MVGWGLLVPPIVGLSADALAGAARCVRAHVRHVAAAAAVALGWYA